MTSGKSFYTFLHLNFLALRWGFYSPLDSVITKLSEIIQKGLCLMPSTQYIFNYYPHTTFACQQIDSGHFHPVQGLP